MTLEVFLIKAVEARRARQHRQQATIPGGVYYQRGGWSDYYFEQTRATLRWIRREYAR